MFLMKKLYAFVDSDCGLRFLLHFIGKTISIESEFLINLHKK